MSLSKYGTDVYQMDLDFAHLAETELKKAKISSIHQAEHAEEAYQKAIAAMQLYSGYKGE